MTEPNAPVVAPSHEPTIPAEPVTPEPVTPEPVTPEPVTPEPVTPVASPPEPVIPADPAKPVDPSAPKPKPTTDMKAEDYKIPEGWPKELSEMAAKGNLTQKQLEGSLNYFAGFMNDQGKVALKQLQEAGTEYMNSWGDAREENVAKTKKAIEYINTQMGEDGFVKYLKKSNQIHHPAMIQALNIISNLLQEGSYIPSNVNRTKGKGKTLAQLMYGDKHPSTQGE